MGWWWALLACAPPDPGADPGGVPLRRLSRAEYDHTVRDLLGTAIAPGAVLFPVDDTSHGFDNQADALSVSSLHVEAWEAAADLLADDVIAIDPRPAVDLSLRLRGQPLGDAVLLDKAGVTADLALAPGRYRFHLDGWAPRDAGLRMRLGAAEVPFDALPAAVELDVSGAGALEVVALAGQGALAAIRVEGPLDRATRNPRRDALLDCDPEVAGERACLRVFVERLLPRAWRRPVTAEEVDAVLRVAERVLTEAAEAQRPPEPPFDLALRAALTRALLSPAFLFHLEATDPDAGGAPRPLGDHELANRLSYFLWSSLPDEALRADADAGRLREPGVLAGHARRMLRDPRAEALVQDFAGQWLDLRAFRALEPDPVGQSALAGPLRDSLAEEMARRVRAFVTGEISAIELLDGDAGAVDAELAAFYGLPAPEVDWAPVDLSGVDRGGLLGLGAVLAVTSPGPRTSPVKRGNWVLGRLLCDAAPPPPDGVEGAIDDGSSPDTVREQLAAHRAQPACASCHDRIDPVGLPLEGFDAAGARRATDDLGHPVDATATLPSGARVDGARELARALAADPRYPACVARQTFTWALGRAPGPSDAPWLDAIEADFAAGDHRFEALVLSVIESPAFTHRRPVEPR